MVADVLRTAIEAAAVDVTGEVEEEVRFVARSSSRSRSEKYVADASVVDWMNGFMRSRAKSKSGSRSGRSSDR